MGVKLPPFEGWTPNFGARKLKLGMWYVSFNILVQTSTWGNFTPKTPRYGKEGVNILEIYIQNEVYIPSFSFLAQKLGGPALKRGAILPQKPLITGGGRGI